MHWEASTALNPVLDEEAPRGQVTCPRLQSKETADLGLTLSSSALEALVLAQGGDDRRGWRGERSFALPEAFWPCVEILLVGTSGCRCC